MGWLLFVVEAPIPDQNPIANLYSSRIFIKLGLNFDQAKANNVMTHVLVLSVKVRRNDSSGYDKL